MRWLSGRASNSGARGQGFDTYLRRVVSLSKTLYSLKSTGNTQEVVAPSRHDLKMLTRTLIYLDRKYLSTDKIHILQAHHESLYGIVLISTHSLKCAGK